MEEVKGWVACTCSMLLVSGSAAAADHTIKTVYCWQEPQTNWTLHRFKPLINPEGRTVFAELSLEGSELEKVRLRRFSPNSEVDFEYTFDAGGKLNGLNGTLTVFGEWIAQANLFADSDGKITPYALRYLRGSNRIGKPENADEYIGRLTDVSVYSTPAAAPCGGMLKEAERMNATQE